MCLQTAVFTNIAVSADIDVLTDIAVLANIDVLTDIDVLASTSDVSADIDVS